MSKRTNFTRIQSPLAPSRSCFLMFLLVLMTTLGVGSTQASTVVRIPTLNDLQPGDTIIVPIMLDSVTGGLDIAGFDFLIAWESNIYKLIDVQEGQLLTDCGWEHFQFTADSMMTEWDWSSTHVSTLRVVSVADLNNGDIHPTCNATEAGELARLFFEVSSHSGNTQRPVPIRFLWNDCGDNGMALADGTLLLSDQVHDWTGDWSADDTFPTWTGAPNVCTDGGAVREVNFYNALNLFGGFDPGAERIPSVKIDGYSNTWLGDVAYANVDVYNTHNNPWGASGFDLLIQYDNTGLIFNSAELGYNPCLWNWEYLNYVDDPAQGFIHLVAIADLNNGDIHPSGLLEGDCTVARMEFQVINDPANIGRRMPLKFLWNDCGDNTFASIPSGDTLYISNEVFDEHGFVITDDAAFPTNQGAPSECLGAPTIRRSVNFFNGSIQVAAEEPVPSVDRGDVNLNGVSHEIADWVLFSNYFFYGLTVFNVHTEAQIANTEVNNDGLALTTADLMYLYRVIIGDALPFPKNTDLVDTAYIIQDTIAHTLSISYPDSLGMLYLTFSGSFDTVQFESETHDIGYLANGSTTRMIVSPKLAAFEGVPSLPNGFLMNYTGDALLVSVQAEYDGISTIPALLQIGDGSPCCIDRGNINHDPAGALDISDLVYLVTYMFNMGPTPPCPGEADVDGNGLGGIDISDLVYLVDYMFNGGPAPVPCP